MPLRVNSPYYFTPPYWYIFAERLSARQLILHRILPNVCVCVFGCTCHASGMQSTRQLRARAAQVYRSSGMAIRPERLDPHVSQHECTRRQQATSALPLIVNRGYLGRFTYPVAYMYISGQPVLHYYTSETSMPPSIGVNTPETDTDCLNRTATTVAGIAGPTTRHQYSKEYRSY